MKIILSEDHATLEQFVMNELKQMNSAGERAYLVVPEQFTLQSDLTLLQNLGTEIIMDIKVKSFTSLSREVLSNIRGNHLPYINEYGRKMLVQFLLDRHQEDISLLCKGKGKRGVTAKIAETVAELRAIDMDPEKMAMLAHESSNELTVQKLRELQLIYGAYKDFIADKQLDNTARLQLLAKLVGEVAYLKDVKIFFYAFHTFTAPELEVVKALEDMGVELYVSIVLPSSLAKQETSEWIYHSAFDISQRFLRQLRKHFILKYIYLKSDTNQETLFKHLSKELFYHGKSQLVKNDSQFQIWKATDTYQEVTYLAGYIKKKIYEEQLRYKDFQIITNHQDIYFPLIKRIFHQYHIPVFIDERKPIINHHFVRFMLLSLTMLITNFSYPVVLSCLRTGITPLTSDEISAFEYFIKAKHLKGTMIFEEKYFNIPVLKRRSRKLEGLKSRHQFALQAREKFSELFGPFREDMLAQSTVKEFTTVLYHFITQGVFLECLHREDDLKDNEHLEIDNQVLESMIELFDQMVETLGEMTVSLEDYVTLIKEGIDELSLGILPPSQDEVQVSLLSRVRTNRVPIQIILGMSDAWLPSQHQGQTIFLKEEKEWLKLHGIELPSDERNNLEDEVLCLYETILKTEQQLIFSFPLSSAIQSSMGESIFVKRALSCLEGQETKSLLSHLRDVRPYLEWETLKHTTEWYRQYTKTPSLAALQHDHANEIAAYYGYFKKYRPTLMSSLENGLHYTNKRKPLNENVAEMLYPAIREKAVSISEIETWQSCPYKHFLRYGIRPEEIFDHDLKNDELGNLIHGCLKRLSEDVKNNPDLLDCDDKQIEQKMDVYLDKELAEQIDHERSSRKKNIVVLGKLKRQNYKAGKYILNQLRNSAFQPKYLEAGFGESHAVFPPIYLEVGKKIIRLEGRIDRIDVWENNNQKYIRVIDYKSGKKEFDLSFAYAGIDLQLLLYLKAALGWSEKPKPAGVFYLSLKEPFPITDSVDEAEIQQAFVKQLLMDGVFIDDPDVINALDSSGEQQVIHFVGRKNIENSISLEAFERLLTHMVEMASESVADILAGNIDVLPLLSTKRNSCTFCEYQDICHFEYGGQGNETKDIETIKWEALKDLLNEQEKEGEDS